jgi:putative drug exporter of the RND superfamily
MALDESVACATATSGAAVVFAGGTVVIALGALAPAGIPEVSALGYTSAIVVVLAVLAALSLLPAVLAVLGPRIGALRIRRPAGAEGSRRWRRSGHAIARHPAAALTVGLGALLLLAAPAALHLGQTDAGRARRAPVLALEAGRARSRGDERPIAARTAWGASFAMRDPPATRKQR